jgi:hypothetical protein
MKPFWAGLVTGVALGVLAHKAASSEQFKNGLETIRIKCENALEKAIEATS